MNDEVTILPTQYAEGRFSADPFDNRPPWVSVALKNGFMAVVPLSERKYGKYKSVWAVKKNDGTIQIAEPGDRISNDMMFGLVVSKLRTNFLTWDDVKPKFPRGKNKEGSSVETQDDTDD